MWEQLDTIGTAGSEGGTIIADEEYRQSCRITLEKCERWDAITCGVYGSMVHTAFADAASSAKKYAAMKQDLQNFIDRDTTSAEEIAFYREFVQKY